MNAETVQNAEHKLVPYHLYNHVHLEEMGQVQENNRTALLWNWHNKLVFHTTVKHKTLYKHSQDYTDCTSTHLCAEKQPRLYCNRLGACNWIYGMSTAITGDCTGVIGCL